MHCHLLYVFSFSIHNDVIANVLCRLNVTDVIANVLCILNVTDDIPNVFMESFTSWRYPKVQSFVSV